LADREQRPASGGGQQNLYFYSANNLIIRYNYVHKQPSWKGYTRPSGGAMIVKNLWETKGWDGALVDSNLFEYNWYQTQTGTAILFTPRLDRQTTGPYAGLPFLNNQVRNITFVNNTIRHSNGCFSIGAYDNSYAIEAATQQEALHAGGGANNFLIKNNLCDDQSGSTWAFGQDTLGFSLNSLDIPGETQNYNRNMTIDHNTIVAGASPGFNSLSIQNSLDATNPPCTVYPGPSADFVVTYNMFPWPIGKDCSTGPDSFVGGASFSATINHNTLALSFDTQTTWDAAFPGQGNLVNSTSNPDGRGANLTQLSALEALIKAGTRP
jgi:hypothetical protein